MKKFDKMFNNFNSTFLQLYSFKIAKIRSQKLKIREFENLRKKLFILIGIEIIKKKQISY